MKDVAFSEEREWRIIHQIYEPAHRTQVKFTCKPAFLSPYVELDIGETRSHQLPKRLPLHTVWVGPGRLSPLSLIAVKAALLKYDYSDSVEIKSSGIAYRIVG
jgi:hypothetical protein